MREDLIDLLRRFSAGVIEVNEFRASFEELNKRGFSSAFENRTDLDAIQNFLAWWVDQYSPALPPRTGVVGGVQDAFGEAIRGEHRVTLAELRGKAGELEQRLTNKT